MYIIKLLIGDSQGGAPGFQWGAKAPLAPLTLNAIFPAPRISDPNGSRVDNGSSDNFDLHYQNLHLLLIARM